MTKIFAVYLQASNFPSQPSEYAFEGGCKQFGRYGLSLSYSSPCVDLLAFFVYVDCHRAAGEDFLEEFYFHISPLFLKGGQYCIILH